MSKNKKYYLFEMKGSYLNIISIILLLFLIFFTFFIKPDMTFNNNEYLLFILLIPYFILHELLHGFSYIIHGAKFKNITFGAHLEKGILCCLCKQNISKKNILFSLLYPFFWIGIVTYIMGILTNNITLVMLSIMNISGCSGDLIMVLNLFKLKNFEYSEYDNPMAFGLYSGEDLSKKKMFGLKYLESVDTLEKNDLKKVSISKASIILFVLYILLVVFTFV